MEIKFRRQKKHSMHHFESAYFKFFGCSRMFHGMNPNNLRAAHLQCTEKTLDGEIDIKLTQLAIENSKFPTSPFIFRL